MNNLEKYLDQVIEQKPIVYEPPAEVQEAAPTSNLMESVRRRWPIVLAVALLVSAAGSARGVVPRRTRLRRAGYGASQPGDGEHHRWFGPVRRGGQLCAVRQHPGPAADERRAAAPEDPRRSGGTESRVLQRQAEHPDREAPGEGLPQDANDLPDDVLRKAIADGKIAAGYLQDSELMAVTMRSRNVDEARIIVNSFLRNYVGQYGVDSTTTESQNITILESQRNEYQKRIHDPREDSPIW